MCLAVELDGNQADPLLEEIVRLRVENAGLRELLGIANIKIEDSEVLPARKPQVPPIPEPHPSSAF